MKKLALATLAAALAAMPATAGNIDADAVLLATIEGIDVVVEDDVDGGCLFNASGINARLSATLERSGIPVSDDSPWVLYAYFYGFPTTIGDRRTGCVVAANFRLMQVGPAHSWIMAGMDGFLSIGPDALDRNAMTGAEQFADEVIAAVLAARRAFGLAGVSAHRS